MLNSKHQSQYILIMPSLLVILIKSQKKKLIKKYIFCFIKDFNTSI